MHFNKRASLEIGINTIVILVIAMMILGLGIGFVKGIFGKLGKVVKGISTDQLTNPPTAQDPVSMDQTELSVKSGDHHFQTRAGIYNKWEEGNYTLQIGGCIGGVKPQLDVLPETIPKGEGKGFVINIYGQKVSDNSNNPTYEAISAGSYICSLQAVLINGNNKEVKDSIQFTLKVTS